MKCLWPPLWAGAREEVLEYNKLRKLSKAWMDASLLRNIFSCDSPKLLSQHDEHVLSRQRLFAKVKRLSRKLRSYERNFGIPNRLEQNQSTL